jgi:hypothetical protein
MALYLLDNLFRDPFAKPALPPNKGKRPRSESTSSSGGNSKNRSARREDRSGGNRRDRGDRREPGFIRGGSRGSSRGGPRGGNHGGPKRGFYDSRSRGYTGYSGY